MSKSFPWPQERHAPIYGICVKYSKNKRILKHYLFNRNYAIIPFTMPTFLVKEAIDKAVHIKMGDTGHGRFNIMPKPGEIWYTYFLFNDGNAPDWKKGDFKRHGPDYSIINGMLAKKGESYKDQPCLEIFDRAFEEAEELRRMINK